MRKHKDHKADESAEQVPVPVEGEGPEEAVEEGELALDKLSADIEALQGELEQLRKDAEESRDRYLRTLADFDNFRKRQREETARQVNLAREDIILQMLSVADNFQRALDAAEAGHSYEALMEGVSLTLRQVNEMLRKEGVEPIEAVGQEFDPEFHEAMMRVETDAYPENTVIDEFEKGYTLNGKVLRPSRVRVAVNA